MADRPASWRMPKTKQMEKLSRRQPVGCIDDPAPVDALPREYWMALLTDPRAPQQPVAGDVPASGSGLPGGLRRRQSDETCHVTAGRLDGSWLFSAGDTAYTLLHLGGAEPKAWDEGRALEDTYERFMKK